MNNEQLLDNWPSLREHSGTLAEQTTPPRAFRVPHGLTGYRQRYRNSQRRPRFLQFCKAHRIRATLPEQSTPSALSAFNMSTDFNLRNQWTKMPIIANLSLMLTRNKTDGVCG
jgi:hypothetical protein